MINTSLKKYIEENIFPIYKKNDLGHNIEHINYVLKRSMKFANTIPNIDLNIVYVVAAYHDIGHNIDAKNHEKVSSEIFLNDTKIKEFFNKEELNIIAEAIIDHRASLEYTPRSIYGKIVSSADRNTRIDTPLRRTYEYNIIHKPELSLEEIIETSRNHLIDKFGKKGYANEKMYFDDDEYKKFLSDIQKLTNNKEEFRERFIKINNLNKKGDLTIMDKTLKRKEFIKKEYEILKTNNPTLSLDELLYKTYDKVKENDNDSFENIKNEILEVLNINEYEYYTKDVNEELKNYIEKTLFTQYENNDKAHGIIHIKEVIRRAFALNDTLKLNLDKNMIYAIAACHDLGKYIDHETHEKIAADIFIKDENMKNFFNDEERITIKEAIEDHRSSKEDTPRTIYGKLISSADRNTRIEIVFIRSFFVGQERTPDMTIEEFLDFTFKRLSKRYGEENPENMFLEDETYKIFLNDMRNLLKNEKEFKDKYCEVNHITSRTNKVIEEHGEIAYTKSLKI